MATGTGLIVTEEGTPQGASPLLGNILLDDLDKELERRCRYVDDRNIYVKTKHAGGRRVKDSVQKFLEGKLKLKGDGMNPLFK